MKVRIHFLNIAGLGELSSEKDDSLAGVKDSDMTMGDSLIVEDDSAKIVEDSSELFENSEYSARAKLEEVLELKKDKKRFKFNQKSSFPNHLLFQRSPFCLCILLK